MGAGPRVGGEDALTRRASAQSRPAHRCLSTLPDTGRNVTGSSFGRGEGVKGGRPWEARCRAPTAWCGGVWGSHRRHSRAPQVPESPGQPSPSSWAASPRPETPAEGFSVHVPSPLPPLSDPSGGRGPDPRLPRVPPRFWVSPPAPDPADGGGDSRPPGPLRSWDELRVLCALPSACAHAGLKSSSLRTWILNSTSPSSHGWSMSSLLTRGRPSVCLSRGSGGHISGASQASTRLSMARTSLPGPPRGLHLPSGHASPRFP